LAEGIVIVLHGKAVLLRVAGTKQVPAPPIGVRVKVTTSLETNPLIV
jgi:hypothetical protein